MGTDRHWLQQTARILGRAFWDAYESVIVDHPFTVGIASLIVIVAAAAQGWQQGSAEGKAAFASAFFTLIGTCIVFAALFLFHLVRAPLKLKVIELTERLEEPKSVSDDQQLILAETETIVERGTQGYKHSARINVKHTGERTINYMNLAIVGIAPFGPNVHPKIAKLCGGMTINLARHDLHKQFSPHWIVVAQHVKNVDFLLFGDCAVSQVHMGDFVLILEATGHNALPALAAFVIGLENSELYFRRSDKPLGELLGSEHPITKRFGEKLTPRQSLGE